MIDAESGRGPALAALVEAIGTHVLDIVAGDPAGVGQVVGWAIHDPMDDSPVPAGSVVLGVATTDRAGAERIVASAEGARAAAVVLRAGPHLDTGLRKRLVGAGVVVLALAEGTSWQELINSLRAELEPPLDADLARSAGLGGLPIDDLFGLANAICLLLDAPVTIEDRSSRVLAFSDRQDEADPARIATVLGRQTPERYLRGDEDRGVMRTLRRSSRPVFIEPGEAEDPPMALPREAIAVRAGDELLGFIWAVVREPLSPAREDLLVEASRFAALLLLEARNGTGNGTGGDRLTAGLGTALEGGPGAEDALEGLGLARQACVVVAIGDHDLASYSARAPFGSNAADLARRSAGRRRLANAFAMHLASVRPGSVVGELGERIYAIVPAAEPAALDSILRQCQQFLDTIGRGPSALIGIGDVAPSFGEVAESRRAAERALRVLQQTGGERRVARTGDVDDRAWLLDLRDMVTQARSRPSGAFARLVEYDRGRGGATLVTTLDAWLASHGDVPGAAERLHVHENTLRYRLRRIGEIGQVDLADPDSRLILALQIRVFGVAPDVDADRG